MKTAYKIVSHSLLLIILLPLCAGMGAVFGAEPYSPGDVNGDGIVNLQDILQVCTAVMGAELSAEAFSAADINRDGIIAIDDILGICGIIFGGETSERPEIMYVKVRTTGLNVREKPDANSKQIAFVLPDNAVCVHHKRLWRQLVWLVGIKHL